MNGNTDDPIKINWRADARTRLQTRELEPRADDGDEAAEAAIETLCRQKTNLVVKTPQEARGLLQALNYICRRTPEGTVWMTPQHRSSFQRLREELRREMEDRGWS